LTPILGRKILKRNGIPIDLLRISVGIENIETIIQEFEKISNLG